MSCSRIAATDRSGRRRKGSMHTRSTDSPSWIERPRVDSRPTLMRHFPPRTLDPAEHVQSSPTAQVHGIAAKQQSDFIPEPEDIVSKLSMSADCNPEGIAGALDAAGRFLGPIGVAIANVSTKT
eukprot:584239-Rhodomonas_salina.7